MANHYYAPARLAWIAEVFHAATGADLSVMATQIAPMGILLIVPLDASVRLTIPA